MDDRDQRIREIAYHLWEQEGCPQGQADRHWAAAVALVEQQDAERGNSNSENGTEDSRGAASSKSAVSALLEKLPRSPPPPLTEASERRRSAASR
jgi:hypothetical protein